VAILEVPLYCDSERYELKEEDVRAWLDFAILEEDAKAKRLRKKIEELEVRRQHHPFSH